jgi:hypothetical protein
MSFVSMAHNREFLLGFKGFQNFVLELLKHFLGFLDHI